jgi:hypothetical protein
MRKAFLLLALLVGCSKEVPPAAVPKPVDPNAPEKIKLISMGTTYHSSDYLVPGYVTILDFYADW